MDIRFYDPRCGAFAGLSNLYLRPVAVDGISFATAEHAYQAAKARDIGVRHWLMAAPTPELAAVVGDALQGQDIVDGWEQSHVDLMQRIVRAKFDQHSDLRSLLVSTADLKIVEWSPSDGPVARFWGEYEGQGLNTLGRILMALRDQYRGQTSSSDA